MGTTWTMLRLAEPGAALEPPWQDFLRRDGVRGLLVALGDEAAPAAPQGKMACVTAPPGAVLRLWRAQGRGRLDVLALHAPLDAALAEALCEALRPALIDAPCMPDLAAWLGGQGYRIHRQCDAWVAEASADRLATDQQGAALIAAARTRYADLLGAGELARAEPVITALAALCPDELAVRQAALGCNLAMGRPAPARRHAQAVLQAEPKDPVANLAMLDAHIADGDTAAEEAARLAIALAPPGAINPLRQLVEAHQLISRWLIRPQPCHAAALVAQAHALPAEGDWPWHYRSLVEAADAALLAPTTPLASHPRTGDAQAILLVAADAHYVGLYGEAYLRSALDRLDVPARIVLHIIGGGPAPGVTDPRLTVTRDAFDAAAVTTRCHDSTGPRAVPVAHLQSIRFAQAEHWLAHAGLPVIVSDIDVILQRGIADLLARHAADDVVLNRNEASQAFGSHLTANLAMFMPTTQGRAFAADLRGYLDRALARADVSRWIDQCGLQMVWHAHACGGGTRFGWFDTGSDINNVIYPRWAPNPFRFLSLFHGFEMDSLPAAA